MNSVTLVLNAGSSNVKFAAFARSAPIPGRPNTPLAPPERLLHGVLDGVGDNARLRAWDRNGAALSGEQLPASPDTPQGHAQTFQHLFGWLERQLPGQHLHGVAHRVVHGGEHFTQAMRVTPELLTQLDALSPLAPLHQPHNLAAIRVVAALAPQLPQVVCFDTAFHAKQPWVMQAYALPAHIREAGVRRYGFHGISYEYIASVLPTHLGEQADGRVVVAHLGNGASMCAMRQRQSVATTMGFTALDGLMMGTRCGNLDPGVVLYLIQSLGMTPPEVEALLYRSSGLLGVSGISGDMRVLQDSADPRAAAAIDLFVARIARELGGLAATLGGLDALVFTAGIGEHSAAIRSRVCHDAAWLGVEIDEAANQAVHQTGQTRISTARSRVSAWVIPTNEERVLAEHAQTLLLGEEMRT